MDKLLIYSIFAISFHSFILLSKLHVEPIFSTENRFRPNYKSGQEPAKRVFLFIIDQLSGSTFYDDLVSLIIQCGNYGNLLSRIFGKKFVKLTDLLKELLNSWFDGIFFSESKFFIFRHCGLPTYIYSILNLESNAANQFKNSIP